MFVQLYKSVKRALFFRPVKEALIAYLHRLPDRIQVSWFRDGDFIVGEIKAGDHEFKTQAFSADEFVTMVNSAILAVNDIPDDYADLVSRIKVYEPRPEEFEKLNNAAIKRSSFGSARDEGRVMAGV
jgi:hypothetical protein